MEAWHFIKQLVSIPGLTALTHQYGTAMYWILIVIVFAETGLVVTPFLPGDSLLFTAGFVASSTGELNVLLLGGALITAAIVGDTVNYHVGRAIGPRVMVSEDSRLFNKKYLDKTHAYFEKYGGKTIILARFVPIVRTFAPFVAGAGAMSYPKFITYNIVGAVAWVTTMMGAGVFLGGLEIVQKHFEKVVILIVLISVMPMVFEFWKSRSEKKADPA
ncbi:MAG: DedA family protein [Deltaproteobacteria bacterium]|nr:DedA family protein [Myxococcales bacterium]MDP3212804.1 DedA family protein [Deltaproteobacteria bacterium]